MRSTKQRTRRGLSMVYTIIIMTGVVALCSLGVDVGRVQLAKTELRNAADASARAAIRDLTTGLSAARNTALRVAADNTADGSPVTLDQNADVEFGTWDEQARSFTVLSGPAASSANAIRVTARRTADRGTALPLYFAKLIGKSSFDLTVSATAAMTGGTALPGLIGIDSVSLKGHPRTDSYNSANGPYTPANSRRNGSLASNGDISLIGNVEVYGDVHAGPGKVVQVSKSVLVTGSTTPLAEPMDFPDAQLPASYINGGSLSISGGETTLAAGAYLYTTFKITGNATIRTTGQITVYVSGPAALTGTTMAHGGVPGNLKIVLLGNQSMDLGGTTDIYADVYAPRATVNVQGTGNFFGSVVAGTLNLGGTGFLHYDEALDSNRPTTPKYALVQ